jgi:hypothetical protein
MAVIRLDQKSIPAKDAILGKIQAEGDFATCRSLQLPDAKIASASITFSEKDK